MANLLQSAQVEQISADSGIPSVSLHQRGLVLDDVMRAGTRFSQLLNLRVFQQYPQIPAIRRRLGERGKSTPLLPFKEGQMNALKARESGLRLKRSVAPEASSTTPPFSGRVRPEAKS
jgi:hypothetical protein